ncbi:MGMT family protein [Prolixibacteraceae bacterium JC049]|jgi:methylated-DNA-protein-cysteine methyltransferase-like protein|nr:MGMT family protein [Prolixibacteraceae bacterium JC049]
MSDFYDQVYQVVALIPVGKVTSYGAIARYLGSPRSSRMVGWALNNLRHTDYYVPAHRVVNQKGILSGKSHFGGQSVMRELLENEGIVIVDDQIQNLETVFWNPMDELELE